MLLIFFAQWKLHGFYSRSLAPPAKEPLSPLPSPTTESAGSDLLIETFVPNQPHIEPANSVVLEVAKMTPYLDGALKALGLHTEARTSFITYVHRPVCCCLPTILTQRSRYWLPSFLKHQYVALRFLPQAAYEKAAPLEISPPSDVTVRIFMLFKGLKEDEVQQTWGAAVSAAQGNVNFWRSVVGVDDGSLTDGSLFRVVEWGGMEVLC